MSCLKQRLSIWASAAMLAGALVWNVGASRAQSKGAPFTLLDGQPRMKLNRAQATGAFAQNLRNLTGGQSFVLEQNRTMESAISTESQRTLELSSSNLTLALAKQWAKRKRPFVMVEENGFWGVDLIETYARWNNLKGIGKAKAIHQLTGVVLDDLPRSQQFDRNLCSQNMLQMALSLKQYREDYEGALPPAETWSDALQPYTKSNSVFNCPSVLKGQSYGYGYNLNLSKKSAARNWNTVALYETSTLRRNAYGTGESLAFRHLGGANYAFADGHVKWFPKNQTLSFKLKP